jgi:hypothetical protein
MAGSAGVGVGVGVGMGMGMVSGLCPHDLRVWMNGMD